MKLPFVSRESHDREVSALYRVIDGWEQRFGILFEKHDALIDKYTDAVRPPVPSLPVMATAVREPRVPDPISKAIREEAGADTRLAAFLRKRAKELKTEHADWTPQQIADELSQWQSTADDGLT